MNSTHPIIKRIDQFIAKHALIPPRSTIIVGLSGGPDSLFLLHYLAALHKSGTIHLIAAHLDHGWRSKSADDAQFCKNAATSLGIACELSTISEFMVKVKNNGSKEEMGRTMRRHFFEQIRQHSAAQSIALAHHANDQQETFFIRLLRGATLTGLTGIKPRAGSYIHPLLCVSKKEILAYLEEQNIVYLTDPTNNYLDFLRNRIRLTVVPALKSADPRFETTFSKTLDRLQETEEFLVDHTEHVWREVACTRDTFLRLHIPSFLNTHTVLQQRLLVRWFIAEQVPFPTSQAFLHEVTRFLTSSSRSVHSVHASWRIVKEKEKMWIERR